MLGSNQKELNKGKKGVTATGDYSRVNPRRGETLG